MKNIIGVLGYVLFFSSLIFIFSTSESIFIDEELNPNQVDQFLDLSPITTNTNFDTSGLLAYYNFEETNGNLINVSPSRDSLGSAANMRNMGVLYEQDGKISKSYYYEPSDTSQVDIDLSSLDFPVSFNGWVKKKSQEGTMQIFMIGDRNTSEVFTGICENMGSLPRVILKIGERSKEMPIVRTQSAPPGVPGDPETLTPEVGWIMVTGVIRDNANIEVYVNAFSREQKVGNLPFPANLNRMAVNIIPDGSPFLGGDGFYDEISFWDRELSQAEITKLYNNGAGLSLLSR